MANVADIQGTFDIFRPAVASRHYGKLKLMLGG